MPSTDMENLGEGARLLSKDNGLSILGMPRLRTIWTEDIDIRVISIYKDLN